MKKLTQSGDLRMKLRFTFRGQTIRLLFAGGVWLLKTFDPAKLKEPSNRPVKGSGAELDPAAADLLYVFEKRVTMLRLRSQAGQDEENGLAERLIVHRDMSHDDILQRAMIIGKWKPR